MEHIAELVKMGDYEKYAVKINMAQYIYVSYMSSGCRHLCLNDKPHWLNSKREAKALYSEWLEYAPSKNTDIITIEKLC